MNRTVQQGQPVEEKKKLRSRRRRQAAGRRRTPGRGAGRGEGRACRVEEEEKRRAILVLGEKQRERKANLVRRRRANRADWEQGGQRLRQGVGKRRLGKRADLSRWRGEMQAHGQSRRRER